MIFHSDRGRQYTSQQFATLADQFGIRLSVGRTGQCWDNALAESFFATIKRELLDTTAWPDRAAARTTIFDFIERPCWPITHAARSRAARCDVRVGASGRPVHQASRRMRLTAVAVRTCARAVFRSPV